ncbi:ABC transporter ATP-binding protein [Mycoplasma corogypsi]|uniref:ABC transporter ATP-binding protein n=1 Tax=Mycoplasma corogypsi TaxID=2106 RepID=UPI0038739944
MENILQISNLNKVYNSSKTGVFDLNFEIKKGEFHAFIGENGAGKTTTIKCIIGSYNSFSGKVLINGIENTNPNSKKHLGYVPEYVNFPKELTTFSYLKSFALLNEIPKNVAEIKINQYLEKFGILDLKNKKPANFSSGQKKKVLLIQSLLHDPEIIILDEPAANLDPRARYELFNLLNELKNEGKSIFISSHVLSEIDKYTDSLTLIDKGKILYSGTKYDHLESIFYEKVINQN